MADTSGLTDLNRKQDLLVACRILEELDVFDEQGHFSARTAPGADTIWINELTSPGTANMDEFCKVDVYADDWPETVPGETVLHTEVYKRRDDVDAVCHNHSPYSIVVGSAGLEMRPVHHVGYVQADPIPVYETYDPGQGTLVVTEAEAATVATLLGDGRAVRLRGHGNTVVGGSIIETTLASLRLEYNARLLYQIASVGDPWYLPRSVVEEIDFMYENPDVMEKSLSYYLAALGQ